MGRLLAVLIAAVTICVTNPGGILEAHAAAVEHQNAINGTTNNYAVIAPTFTGTSTSGGPQSFIRLFNGAGSAGGTSTFTVSVVGVPSGQLYGAATTTQVPHFAAIQFSIQEILSLTGAGALTGGDTGYAVYLQNADLESGYQHVVYDWTTSLFENLSSCGSLINEQMIPLHNEMVLTNVQTSKDSYPSTITIHNYDNVPITYTLTVYNAGNRPNGVTSTTSGKETCQITGNTVAANSSLSIPFSTIESHSGCTLDSDEYYANIVVANADTSGTVPPNAVLTHLIHVSQYNGNSNLTDTCAVNKVTSTSSSASAQTSYTGTIAGADGTSGAFTLTVQASIAHASALARAQNTVEKTQAVSQASGSLTLSGSVIPLTGSYDSTTNVINVSGGSYTFTGSVSNGAYSGTYTGPNSSSGPISALDSTSSTVTTYCGTWSDPPDSGTWNMQVAANGAVSGESTGGKNVTISGQKNGSTITGTTSQTGVTYTATITNNTISGTVGGSGSGTFSGGDCTNASKSTTGGSTSGGSTTGGSGGKTVTGVAYTLSLSVTGNGAVAGTATPPASEVGAPAKAVQCTSGTCTAQYDDGTSVVLTATPGSGETFTGWSGACSGTGTCTVNMTGNVSVNASFSGTGTSTNATGFLLSFSETMSGGVGTSGTGSVTSSPTSLLCNGGTCQVSPGGTTSTSSSFPAGTTLVLTASVANGATFQGWGGACSGTGTCSVVMSAARTVSATFNPHLSP